MKKIFMNGFMIMVLGIAVLFTDCAPEVEVIFNANGGEGTMESQTITTDSTVNSTTNSFTQ